MNRWRSYPVVLPAFRINTSADLSVVGRVPQAKPARGRVVHPTSGVGDPQLGVAGESVWFVGSSCQRWSVSCS